jgi:hypothetical protein
VFEERETYDAIVCALVFGEGGAAEDGVLVEGAVYAGWVEDLVDAVIIRAIRSFKSVQDLQR